MMHSQVSENLGQDPNHKTGPYFWTEVLKGARACQEMVIFVSVCAVDNIHRCVCICLYVCMQRACVALKGACACQEMVGFVSMHVVWHIHLYVCVCVCVCVALKGTCEY